MNQEPSLQDIFDMLIFLKDNAASKDDLVNFVSKDDIANMATKDDIANMVTKNDIVNMATKDDIAQVQQELNFLEVKIDSVKDDMITHVDGFIGLYKRQEQELAAVVLRQTRLKEKVLSN